MRKIVTFNEFLLLLNWDCILKEFVQFFSWARKNSYVQHYFKHIVGFCCLSICMLRSSKQHNIFWWVFFSRECFISIFYMYTRCLIRHRFELYMENCSGKDFCKFDITLKSTEATWLWHFQDGHENKYLFDYFKATSYIFLYTLHSLCNMIDASFRAF